MKPPTSERVIEVSCVLALVALGLIAWSLLDPRPIPVILAMSLGQAIGTASFAAFLIVVVRDLTRGRAAKALGSSESAALHGTTGSVRGARSEGAPRSYTLDARAGRDPNVVEKGDAGSPHDSAEED